MRFMTSAPVPAERSEGDRWHADDKIAGIESRAFFCSWGKSFPPCCLIRERKVSQLCWHGGPCFPKNGCSM